MTPAELQKAFAAPGAAVIEVPGGTYPPMTLKGSDKTLIPKDGVAVFQRLRVGGARLKFSGLHFDTMPNAAELQWAQVGLLINGCVDVEVTGCQFLGGMMDKGIGLRADDCSDLKITGNTSRTLFQHFNINRCSDVSIERNDIQGVGENGLSIAGCEGIAIRDNRLVDFTAQGNAHPDGIQLWTARREVAGGTEWYPVHDVLIERNTILQGSGTGMQGIFHRSRAVVKAGEAVADELTRCRRWKIRDNLIYTWGQWHGIALQEGVSDVEITRNRCLSPTDDALRCWILLADVDGARLIQNIADDYQGKSMPADLAAWGNLRTAQVLPYLPGINARAGF